MSILLTTDAFEKSTYIIKLTIEDEIGNLIIPTSLSWTLSNNFGVIINNRQDIPILSPVSIEHVVLSGDDLQITKELGRKRVITVKGTCDFVFGNNLPINGQAFFNITSSAIIT